MWLLLLLWRLLSPVLPTPPADEDEEKVDEVVLEVSVVEVALIFLRKVFVETTEVKEASGSSESCPRDSARARARHRTTSDEEC